MVCEEKLRFFVLLLRTICHKVGLAINTVGPCDMDEQLVPLFWGPNERFRGGRTVGPLWGAFLGSIVHMLYNSLSRYIFLILRTGSFCY